MNAQDLMLGDLVTFRDCQKDTSPAIIKVWQINADNVAFVSIDGNDGLDEISIDDEIVGLPITPEIFEKNGFEYENNVGYVYDNYEGIIITCSTFISRLRIIKDLNILYDSQDYADIYVHTIQHALRLCGIEKEIVL